jgi:alkanesulfonate monooxygenase SsuD/methylene tetrahydromethanopterin reductase-like flavin-dependent oxidoreductase (luciferase family)
MPDYGHEIEFGYFLVPDAGDPDGVLETARLADRLEYDLLGVQDHPYQSRFIDTFALVATLLADTGRISFFTDVANLPLRPPAVMAKMAASLDVLSGGRFELGLGAGAIPHQIARMGGPDRSGPESVDALEEAIDVIRLMWSGERSVSYEGRYYQLDDARPGPEPVHPMGIWLGAFRPRMISLVGTKAGGWVPSLGVLSVEELRAGNQRIDAAADAAGRDPARIRRALNLQGVIGDSRRPPSGELPVGYLLGEPLAGLPEWWAETLAGFVEDGFDTLVFWPVDPTPDQVELFANEVVPLLSDQEVPRDD